MFLGDYQHTLDAKGRVSLPAKFRAEMTGKLFMVKGPEKCLYIYSADEYSRFVERLPSAEDFDPRKSRFRRFFMAGAADAEIDSAGRIKLPAVLVDYAGLKKDVAVIGNGNRIELWDAETWAAYNNDEQGSISDLASELATLGLL
jgi:MraZ protein